jgi:hypothetical protein
VIGCIPKLEGRQTLAQELLLRSHNRWPREVGPLDRRLRRITIWRHIGSGPIRGIDHHGQRRPLGREWLPAGRYLRLSIGRRHGGLPLHLAHRPLRLSQLTPLHFRLRPRRSLFPSLLLRLLLRLPRYIRSSGSSFSFPASHGVSTTFLVSSTSPCPVSWADVAASSASMVSRFLVVDPGS